MKNILHLIVLLIGSYHSHYASSAHYVDLYWDYESTDSVTFNVYRKKPASTTYNLVHSHIKTTALTDKDVVGGKTYDYVVTAVVDGVESGYSNQIAVTVPE